MQIVTGVCATRDAYIRIVEYEYFYFRFGEGGDMTYHFYDDSDNRAEVTTTKQLLIPHPQLAKSAAITWMPLKYWMK